MSEKTLRARERLFQKLYVEGHSEPFYYQTLWNWLPEFKTYAMIYNEFIDGYGYDYNHVVPFDFNRRAPPEFQHLPLTKQGWVFRALRLEEEPSDGLIPKLPLHYGQEFWSNDNAMWCRGTWSMDLDEHIKSGSQLNESLYISTSWCPVAALFFSMKAYASRHQDPAALKIVAINLGPEAGVRGVREHAYIYDVSNQIGRESYLEDVKARNYARVFEEVILEGVVPPEAIVSRMTLADLCSMLKDPNVLLTLRDDAFSSFDAFKDACAGGIENALRRFFGLPAVVTLYSERRFLENGSNGSRRVTLARYEGMCHVCGAFIALGSRIAKVPLHGWCHAHCVGLQDILESDPTRRGGMSARLRSRLQRSGTPDPFR